MRSGARNRARKFTNQSRLQEPSPGAPRRGRFVFACSEIAQVVRSGGERSLYRAAPTSARAANNTSAAALRVAPRHRTRPGKLHIPPSGKVTRSRANLARWQPFSMPSSSSLPADSDRWPGQETFAC